MEKSSVSRVGDLNMRCVLSVGTSEGDYRNRQTIVWLSRKGRYRVKIIIHDISYPLPCRGPRRIGDDWRVRGGD